MGSAIGCLALKKSMMRGEGEGERGASAALDEALNHVPEGMRNCGASQELRRI